MSDEVRARAFEPVYGTRGVGKGRGLGSVTVALPRQGAAGPLSARGVVVPA